jgi:hypothetical protein
MKERNIKELLQLMLDNQDLFKEGLCSWLGELYFIKNKISYKEYNLLYDYIYKNAPFPYKINIFSARAYYWKKGDIKPRIKWLKKHINKIKD